MQHILRLHSLQWNLLNSQTSRLAGTIRQSTSTTHLYKFACFLMSNSKILGRAWLPICSRSLNPLFTTRATGSPARSRRALVATVVPMRIHPICLVSTSPSGVSESVVSWDQNDTRIVEYSGTTAKFMHVPVAKCDEFPHVVHPHTVQDLPIIISTFALCHLDKCKWHLWMCHRDRLQRRIYRPWSINLTNNVNNKPITLI